MTSKYRADRDVTMMLIAHGISARSTCVRRSVGCVLVDEYGRVLSMGHNGVARGQTHCIDDPCEGANQPSGHHLDRCLAMHAEMNALLFCKDIMEVDICYATASPCIQCIKALMQSSCRAIIFDEIYDTAPLNIWISSKRGRTYKHMERKSFVQVKVGSERPSETSGDETSNKRRQIYARDGEDLRRKPATDS